MSGIPGNNHTANYWYEYCSRMSLAKLGYTTSFETLTTHKADIFMRIAGFMREWENEQSKKSSKKRGGSY